MNNDYKNSYLFKLKLFRIMQKKYMANTPESDSLYRRRNKLVMLGASFIFYSYTHKHIDEYKILIKSRINKKLIIGTNKVVFLCIAIAIPQLILKYIYYLNKVYKSYQFGLESVLKYNILQNKNYQYRETFDIIDFTNIKKFQ